MRRVTHRTHLSPVVLTCLVTALAIACDGEAPGSVDAAAPDATAAPPVVDAGETDSGRVDSGRGSDRDAAAPAGGGSLVGSIRRTAEPRAGGVGHVYVAVFDRDPVLNRDDAVLVGRALVEDADLRAPDATVSYRVNEVPPRAEPYFVTAFLDDNGTVDAANPGPDRGDLVSLDGLASPSVTVDRAGDVPFDIVLNANLPF